LGAGSDKFGGKYWGGIYGSLIFKTGIYSSFTLQKNLSSGTEVI
jgi:hypothetical protein